MIHDTGLGNWSCDRSGDLSPTFSKFVCVCLCLFTYVWSLDLFWKLYIVPTLRELTSLSFNINHDTLVLSLFVWGRPSDWCWAQVCTWEPYLDYGGTNHYTLPVIPRGSCEQIVYACYTKSPLFQHVQVFFLTENMCLTNNSDPIVQQFASFQLWHWVRKYHCSRWYYEVSRGSNTAWLNSQPINPLHISWFIINPTSTSPKPYGLCDPCPLKWCYPYPQSWDD